METNVPRQLQFSYDRLKSKNVQHCFLYCALYPEDFKIPKEELIDYWIAEGLVDERASMQATYDGGYSILNRLVNNCLLETADDGRCVKMHDLIREMALYITSMSPLFMVKAGEKLRELPREQEWKENLEKASLMMNDISEIPPNMSPDCPALSTLVLRENAFYKSIPESFFLRMQGLTILDLSYTSIEKLPDSISHLTNLTALLLQYCQRLKLVPCLAKLVCLRNLNLEGTRIIEVPEGMEMLQKLRYLNLFSTYLQKLPTGMLSKLSCVQKLRVYWGSKTSKETVEEASKLSELDTFEAFFERIQDFKIYVKSLGSGGPRLRKYSLTVGSPPLAYKTKHGMSYFCYLFWPEDVDADRNVVFDGNFVAPPKDLQCLALHDCHNVRSLSDVLSNEGEYSDLKEIIRLEVYDCSKIDKIISEEDGRSNTMGFTLTLPTLKILRLLDLPHLSSNGVMVCDSLEQIEVSQCPKLKRLPVSLPLPAIKEIKVEEDWVSIMESKETQNRDDIPTSTSPPLRNEDVRSNSSLNEQGQQVPANQNSGVQGYIFPQGIPFQLPGNCVDGNVSPQKKVSKVLLKGMRYPKLQQWVQSHGFRSGQALMLWKRLYGNNIWAHCIDEMEVIIPCDRGRTTVCVSSQVGCAMNCQFCYTGRQDGFDETSDHD
ncbi:hypothetical protein Patl1_34806 [Pistacia atlantica]|uniref:Uncharacterized protein n=1 Tax=Pistacia atlantica TaxID=434234 RepID=A0ACC0ZQY2_9ROSI|nr:hypothetical protein Patl1_34806 [Pistacia atlantica]